MRKIIVALDDAGQETDRVAAIAPGAVEDIRRRRLHAGVDAAIAALGRPLPAAARTLEVEIPSEDDIVAEMAARAGFTSFVVKDVDDAA